MLKKRYKIAHVTSSLKTGGAERVLCCLVQGIATEHVVLYFHAGPFVAKLQEAGVRTVAIKGLVCRYDPLFFLRLYRALRQENPDVVHSLLWAANVATRVCAYFLRKPVVTAYHNHVTQNGWVRNMLDRLTMRLSYTHIAVSHEVAQSVCNIHGPIGMKALEVITNGVNMPVQYAGYIKQDLGLDQNIFVIGAVGRFVSLKRFDVLLEVVALVRAQHARVHLLLIGTGPELDALQKLACTLGIAAHVTYIVDEDAHAYYRACDCFVQTSDVEGISMALLEAMSYRLPCVVMGQSFQHPVIEHDYDGLVCMPGNKQMLAAYILLLIKHEKEAHRLARCGYAKVCRDFNAHDMIEKYAKLFDKAFCEYPD